MAIFPLFGKKEDAPAAQEGAGQPKSALDLVQGGFGQKGVMTKVDDDYEFEDIEATKLRHGIKPQTKKRVVGHSWTEIAVGTAQSCAMMGTFGALMGLSVGAVTGPVFAPKGHRLPVTIALMKKQALWFGVIFGGGGGLVGALRRYA